jgi:hypothetical protein
LRSTRARLAASGELRVTSQHLCCLRSSLPFDRERSRTQALTWLALPTRFTRSSGPAVNLGPHRPEASSRLTALRQFALSPVFRQRLESPLRCSRPTGLRPGDIETPRWLSPVRAPLYLSIEAGVTLPCSAPTQPEGWRSLRITNRLRRSPLSGPRFCLSAPCDPPALRACGPSLSIAACGCFEFRAGAVLASCGRERAHAPFDSGTLHPLAAGLRPTLKLAACGFESPHSIAAACALPPLSRETGVTSPCSHSGSQVDRSTSPEAATGLRPAQVLSRSPGGGTGSHAVRQRTLHPLAAGLRPTSRSAA